VFHPRFGAGEQRCDQLWALNLGIPEISARARIPEIRRPRDTAIAPGAENKCQRALVNIRCRC
jgi:hypothetical protein